MGKERDELIRRLGGTPVSDLNLTDEEIEQLERETYTKRGKVPPDIRHMITKHKKEKSKSFLSN